MKNELAWAWIFRGFLALLMILIGAVGWFARDTLIEVRKSVDEAVEQMKENNRLAIENKTTNAVQDSRIFWLEQHQALAPR